MRINTRNTFLKLNHTFQKTSTRQKGLSYIGPAIWNRIPEIFKKTINLNTFKHKMKHYYPNISPLLVNNELITEFEAKANIFNKYLASQCTTNQ